MVGESLPCAETYHFRGNSSVFPFVFPLVVMSPCLITGLHGDPRNWIRMQLVSTLGPTGAVLSISLSSDSVLLLSPLPICKYELINQENTLTGL